MFDSPSNLRLFLSLKPNDSNLLDSVEVYLNIVKAAKIHDMKTNSVIELNNNLFDLVERLSSKEDVEATDHRLNKKLRKLHLELGQGTKLRGL